MELSRSITHLLMLALLIGSISCQTSDTPGVASETPAAEVEPTEPAAEGTAEEGTAAPAAPQDAATEPAKDDESATSGTEGGAGTASNGAPATSSESQSPESQAPESKAPESQSPAAPDSGVSASATQSPVTENVVIQPLSTEGGAVKPTQAASAPVEKSSDPKVAKVPDVPAVKEVTTEEITTVPTTTEPPMPKCEDPIAKAAEVQKCNDKIKQDSLCIQIQKAVDCVEERANCSEANFDQEIDKYLASFENYAKDHKCIITYKGKRLEQRRRPGQAAQSQAQSGTSPIYTNLFSSLAVIVLGMFYSH